jgi:hypothetical protein
MAGCLLLIEIGLYSSMGGVWWVHETGSIALGKPFCPETTEVEQRVYSTTIYWIKSKVLNVQNAWFDPYLCCHNMVIFLIGVGSGPMVTQMSKAAGKEWSHPWQLLLQGQVCFLALGLPAALACGLSLSSCCLSLPEWPAPACCHLALSALTRHLP